MIGSILYVSSLCSQKTEKRIFQNDPKSIGLQVQKYHRLLARGFAANGVAVKALSYHKGLQSIFASETENEDGIEYRYIRAPKGKTNHLSVLWKAFWTTRTFLKLNKDAGVICDVLNFSVSTGAILAARLMGRKVVGIITDFPEMLSGKCGLKESLHWKIIHKCTGYVLLTEAMAERVRPGAKPYLVIEGQVDSAMEEQSNCLENKWSGLNCVYAGGLHKKYGIETLVKAFILADVPNSFLHIYGDGDFVPELRHITNDHIIYHGIVPNSEVVAAEIASTLLINPRPTTEEFVKYSFPSKNMEYMSSGTPVLTTNLPGMPEEYKDYVYIFDDETVQGIARKIREVLSLPTKGLYRKGKAAKEFVLNEKNNIRQAQKILQLFT